jgi:hypothetical protein
MNTSANLNKLNIKLLKKQPNIFEAMDKIQFAKASLSA